MTPRGATALIEMRMDGKRPSGFTFVTMGDFKEPDWWKWANTADIPELLIRPEDSVERLDFRCLVGLPVILYLADYDQRAAIVYQKLQAVCRSIAVESPAFEDDIGWVWSRECGRFGFDGIAYQEAA